MDRVASCRPAGVVSHEELVDRVGLEVGCIVGIRVAAGETEAALADECGQVVLDLPCLAPLGEAGRQLGRQVEFGVDRLELDRAAVGALVRGVEERGEQHCLDQSLFDHSRVSFARELLCLQRLTTLATVLFPMLRIIHPASLAVSSCLGVASPCIGVRGPANLRP